MKKTLLQLSTLLLCFHAHAQSHIDSFDINKKNDGGLIGSSPGSLTAVSNTLYFMAYDSSANNQLWAFYNGATEPTLLSNFDSKKRLFNIAQEKLPVIDGTIYFAMSDSAHGTELWSMNSSGAYTLVKDIMPGTMASYPGAMFVHDKILYFKAADTAAGNELWHHIPATNVTERITSINPLMGSSPYGMTAFNNKIYFSASDSLLGNELFEYDPATKKTRIVADINLGVFQSSPINLTVLGNKLYFSASKQGEGYELWSYDGASAPKKITQLSAASTSGVSIFVGFAAYKNKLYFGGSFNKKYELTCYDPATDKVTMVHAINPAAGGANLNNLTVYNNLLFFTANDGTNGMEIWKYDGSTTPSIVTDINPPNSFGNFANFAATPHELFFCAYSTVIGQELFRLSFNKLGVENVAFKGEVAAYPNPATDAANIQMKLQESQSLTISVTDMNGRVVYTTGNVLYSAATHTINIPMRNLPSGTYTYHISTPQGSLMNSGKLQKL